MAVKDKYQTVTADTKKLLDVQEGREVDFKQDPKAIDSEDLVAFANAGGGTVLAGVEEHESGDGTQSGRIIGCRVDDKTKQAIVGKASSCRPSIDLSIRVENSSTKQPILRIDVPEGSDKPYATSGGTYKIRAEGRNVGISPQLMKAMILEAEADQFVARFRHAADDLIGKLDEVSERLTSEIQAVGQAAERASQAALSAASAAQDAIDAAESAASAAEDAAMGGY